MCQFISEVMVFLLGLAMLVFLCLGCLALMKILRPEKTTTVEYDGRIIDLRDENVFSDYIVEDRIEMLRQYILEK